MNTAQQDRAEVPVYLQRYAEELDELERTVTAVRGAHPPAADLRVHPKDRALFALIDSVLAEHDDCNRVISDLHREGNAK